MDDKKRNMIWFLEFMGKNKGKHIKNSTKCKICGSAWMIDSQRLCEECRQRYGRMAGMP